MQAIRNATRLLFYNKIGTDNLNNVYFESKRLNPLGRKTRFVEYGNKIANSNSMEGLHNAFEESTKLPVSWQSWLRYTRQEPPN